MRCPKNNVGSLPGSQGIVRCPLHVDFFNSVKAPGTCATPVDWVNTLTADALEVRAIRDSGAREELVNASYDRLSEHPELSFLFARDALLFPVILGGGSDTSAVAPGSERPPEPQFKQWVDKKKRDAAPEIASFRSFLTGPLGSPLPGQMTIRPLLEQSNLPLESLDLAILLILNLLRLQGEPGPVDNLVGQKREGEAFEESAAVGLIIGSVGVASWSVEL